MNILYFVPYVPSLVRVRPYNLIRFLHSLDHHVTLCTLWTNDEELQNLEALKTLGITIRSRRQTTWRTLVNGFSALRSGQPLQAWYSWDPEAARELAEQAFSAEDRDSYDIVHVEHLRGVNYGLYLNRLQSGLAAGQQRRIPVVWDSVDCISYLFRQSAEYSRSFLYKRITNFELPRTEAFEADLPTKFAKVLVTSEIDKQAFVDLSGRPETADRIQVIPNGVDFEYFRPNPDLIREEGVIVFSGKMSYHANITMVLHFVEDIFPIILQRRPDARFWIVGKDPSRKIIDLATHPNITVTGTVADIRPYLQRASAAVVPLVYGAGNQNKLLESMACGTPVVATPRAVQPLQAEPGKELLVADQPAEFAEKTVQLLDNPGLRASIGSAGRAYVVRNHDWVRISNKLEEVYHAVIQANYRISR